MAEKFQNKYRIPSARLPNWDYRWNAAYFVTICTQNREYYFGDVANKKMKLSRIGIIADIIWHEIKNHTKNVELDAFIVMPNHIHGILILNGNNPPHATPQNKMKNCQNVQTLHATSPNTNNNPNQNEKTLHATSLPSEKNATPLPPQQMAKISPKPNSLSTIVRSYKSAVTKHAHRLGFEFAWQPRFYDNIIRNNTAFENIQNYITNNPLNWNNDKFYE